MVKYQAAKEPGTSISVTSLSVIKYTIKNCQWNIVQLFKCWLTILPNLYKAPNSRFFAIELWTIILISNLPKITGVCWMFIVIIKVRMKKCAKGFGWLRI